MMRRMMMMMIFGSVSGSPTGCGHAQTRRKHAHRYRPRTKLNVQANINYIAKHPRFKLDVFKIPSLEGQKTLYEC